MSAENTETVVQPNANLDPAAASASSPPNEGADGANGSETRDDKGKFRSPLQPRIDELTRDKHDARREAAYWRQRAEALEQAGKPAAEPPKKPEASEFDSYDAYVEALADWKADQKIDSKLKARDEQSAATRQAETRANNWDKSVAAAREKHADYDDVMSASDVPIANHVAELLLDSEAGATVALHLAKNADVAKRLNAMTSVAAARELGKIEAQLAVAAEPPANEEDNGAQPPAGGDKPLKDAVPAAKPKTSAAPAPAKTVGQNRSTKVPLEKMSMDDYVKTRTEQGARWAR